MKPKSVRKDRNLLTAKKNNKKNNKVVKKEKLHFHCRSSGVFSRGCGHWCMADLLQGNDIDWQNREHNVTMSCSVSK